LAIGVCPARIVSLPVAICSVATRLVSLPAAIEYLVSTTGDRILERQIDRLTERYKDSNPDFYHAYRVARIIVDAGGGGPTPPTPPTPPKP
jgi:hypothetical protein